MPKFFLFAFAFVLSIKLQAQTVKKQNLLLIETDFLKKSHKQKIAALSLLGGGVLLINFSLKIIKTNTRNGNYSKQFLHNTMFIAGGLSMIGSIPFFISSARNKGIAQGTKVGFKLESLPQKLPANFVQNKFPAIAIKIGL